MSPEEVAREVARIKFRMDDEIQYNHVLLKEDDLRKLIQQGIEKFQESFVPIKW